jgi:hypothetical protein
VLLRSLPVRDRFGQQPLASLRCLQRPVAPVSHWHRRHQTSAEERPEVPGQRRAIHAEHFPERRQRRPESSKDADEDDKLGGAEPARGQHAVVEARDSTGREPDSETGARRHDGAACAFQFGSRAHDSVHIPSLQLQRGARLEQT